MSALTDAAPAFVAVAHRIVWATVATTDPEGRPRSRVLHPLWVWDGEHLVGWIATSPTPVKTEHLAVHPFVSVNYWDPSHDTASADCRATWVGDDESRTWLWSAFEEAPAPVGYDPAMIPAWSGGPTSPAFGVLRLDPYRLRVQSAAPMTGDPTVAIHRWHATSPVT